jgi:esterase/lipase superfamily enzyme
LAGNGDSGIDRRGALLLGAGALLAGCAPRGALTVAPEAASVGSVKTLYVATSRRAEGGANLWGGGRSEALGFARLAVSVPPDRAPGTVTFPTRLPPDPARDFLKIGAQDLRDDHGFRTAIDRALAERPVDGREVIVFVHGFNTNFSEGLYRQAQMAHDFNTPGLSVHYSWPSAARVTAYAFDRESAIFARDGLEAVLGMLAQTRARRIIVSGHSMGAMVLMEALRSMAQNQAERFFERLQAVVLMAPDLDTDVFRGQVRPLVARGVPIYVVYSSADRALRVSSRLRGQSQRLGSLRSLEAVSDLPITLIDTTDIDDAQDALGHFAVATSPTLIAMIRGLDRLGGEMFSDADRSRTLLDATVETVQNVTDVVLQPTGQ